MVYCTSQNRPFLLWLNSKDVTKLNSSIHEEPAMSFDIVNYQPSEPQFPITKATTEDADGIVDLMIRHKPKLDRAHMITYVRQLIISPDVIFYIASYEGKIVGTRMIHYQQDYVQGYCNLVDSEYRRHGIATALLTQALNDAKERGIIIFTNQTTPDGFKFCTRFGLQQVGTYIYL